MIDDVAHGAIPVVFNTIIRPNQIEFSLKQKVQNVRNKTKTKPQSSHIQIQVSTSNSVRSVGTSQSGGRKSGNRTSKSIIDQNRKSVSYFFFFFFFFFFKIFFFFSFFFFFFFFFFLFSFVFCSVSQKPTLKIGGDNVCHSVSGKIARCSKSGQTTSSKQCRTTEKLSRNSMQTEHRKQHRQTNKTRH